MEMVGRVCGVKTEEGIVAFKVRELIPLDPKAEYLISKRRVRRSLDANNYYYALSNEICQEIGISHTEYHNRVLAELGILQLNEEKKPFYALMPDSEWWLRQLEGTEHYAPCDATEEKKGKTYRWFVLLKPTREFNTKEMSMLIDYVIQDAVELGISTLSDNELNKLKAEWNQ